MTAYTTRTPTYSSFYLNCNMFYLEQYMTPLNAVQQHSYKPNVTEMSNSSKGVKTYKDKSTCNLRILLTTTGAERLADCGPSSHSSCRSWSRSMNSWNDTNAWIYSKTATGPTFTYYNSQKCTMKLYSCRLIISFHWLTMTDITESAQS